MKVLVTRRLPGDALKKLAMHCEVDLWEKETPIPRDTLIDRIRDKDALLCLLTDKIDAEVMDAAPGLRIISNYAVGYDNIDVMHAIKSSIVVSNTPGVLTDATADLTWAIILSLARRIVEADRFARSGNWQGWDPNLMLGYDVHSRTLGIVGAGRIGTAVASRARGFNMEVVYTSRSINKKMESLVKARRIPLEELLSVSDFVTLHVPLTPETKHMIGQRELSLMKSTAFLINTSRGAVVDEVALVHALQNKTIAGAGLDVFEHEPSISSRLIELPNVVILPHIGSATHATRSKMADIAVENIISFMTRGRPLYEVKQA
ncbi:MAG: D-glycerate dehydrogenase [Deltaproteobacteria bacterium]|nr:MAG: D-glycerate dehydrogenase [Deltaproteobacteria bacterium]